MKTGTKTKIYQSNENRNIMKKESFMEMLHLDGRYYTESVKYREEKRLDMKKYNSLVTLESRSQ